MLLATTLQEADFAKEAFEFFRQNPQKYLYSQTGMLDKDTLIAVRRPFDTVAVIRVDRHTEPVLYRHE